MELAIIQTDRYIQNPLPLFQEGGSLSFPYRELIHDMIPRGELYFISHIVPIYNYNMKPNFSNADDTTFLRHIDHTITIELYISISSTHVAVSNKSETSSNSNIPTLVCE